MPNGTSGKLYLCICIVYLVRYRPYIRTSLKQNYSSRSDIKAKPDMDIPDMMLILMVTSFQKLTRIVDKMATRVKKSNMLLCVMDWPVWSLSEIQSRWVLACIHFMHALILFKIQMAILIEISFTKSTRKWWHFLKSKRWLIIHELEAQLFRYVDF